MCLKTRAQRLGIDVKFTAVDVSSYEDWVRMQGKDRYILTLLARRIRADQLAAVAEVISTSGLNIDNITRLSGRVSLSIQSVACVYRCPTKMPILRLLLSFRCAGSLTKRFGPG